MMYPLQTVVTQAAYPPANNSPSVYQENLRALLHQQLNRGVICDASLAYIKEDKLLLHFYTGRWTDLDMSINMWTKKSKAMFFCKL